MKCLKIFLFSFFIVFSLNAKENDLENIDKLDVLDKQSKEFFKAITGLEKDYLEEQIEQINKNKESAKPKIKQIKPNSSQNVQQTIKENLLSPQEYEKDVFRQESELARLTDDFTRTRMLKDIKIKSIYTFNNNSYVILRLDKNSQKSLSELSSNIEGRYKKGDLILGHRLVSVSLRTKSIKLYKKLDDKYGYYIYISNYGISVSNLQKRNPIVKKKITKKKIQTTSKKLINKQENKKNFLTCTYKVKVRYINVRNKNNIKARILRVLRKNDSFTVEKELGNWLKIDTIYKNMSGDTMVVKNQNNWIKLTDNVIKNCN